MSLESRSLRLITFASLGAAVLLGAAGGAHASVIIGNGYGAKLYTDEGQFVRDLPADRPVDQGGWWSGLTNGPGTDVLLVGKSRVEHFDGLTGDHKGRFAELPAGVEPSRKEVFSAVYRPGGELVATTMLLEESSRYDATTGAYLGTVGTPGHRINNAEPSDVTFGPDGDLYLGTVGTSVFRYDGTTYAPKGIFATNPLRDSSGQPGRTSDVAFGPDGDLYASDPYGGRIVRFDGLTGAFKGVFSAEGAWDCREIWSSGRRATCSSTITRGIRSSESTA